MIHELKTNPVYFEAIRAKEKTFEVRKADRLYSVGDYLALNEYKESKKEYTGQSILAKVTYLLSDPQYCKEGYVILGIDIISAFL